MVWGGGGLRLKTGNSDLEPMIINFKIVVQAVELNSKH